MIAPRDSRPRIGRQLRGVLAALGIVASLAIATPVAAVQPSTFYDVETHGDSIDCGSFTADLERTLSGTVSIFLDQQGNAIRLQAPTTMVGSISANGTTIAIRGHLLFVIDFVTGTYTFNGQVFMANAHGSGVTLQDTGKYRDNADGTYFEAGPHDVEDLADPFCPLLR